MTILLPLLGFVFVSLLVSAARWRWRRAEAPRSQRRLGEVTSARTDQSDEPPPDRTVIDALKRMGAIAPRSAKELGKLQQRLVTAGYRSREAMVVFFGIRLGFAVLCFAAHGHADLRPVRIWRWRSRCAPSGTCCRAWSSRAWRRSRQHRMRLGLADALDLLVVSVEAGLGLDQALQRVAEELMFAHPELCDELRLINLELRAGTARSEALHNLARRTQLDDITSLVTMLVQTDKFGTSVAQSLRVHSETLRTKRRQRAEEAAAKTGVKMVFPLVFCIFPAIWVVTIGPATIKFVQVLLPMAQP